MTSNDPGALALSGAGAARAPATPRLLFDVAHDARLPTAVALDGPGRHLHSGRATAPAGYPFSVAQWVRRDAGHKPGGLWSSMRGQTGEWHGYYTYLEADGTISLFVVVDTDFAPAVKSAVVPESVWTLVVAVYRSPTDRSLCVGGRWTHVGGGPARSPVGVDTTALGVICNTLDEGLRVGAKLGPAAAWSRSLTEAEEATLRAGVGHAGLPADLRSGLLSWWEPGVGNTWWADRHGRNALVAAVGLTPVEGPDGVGDGPHAVAGPLAHVAGWELDAGVPPASYEPFGPTLAHAPDRRGFRQAGNLFGGTAWEVGIRAHVPAVKAGGMPPTELCRSEGADGSRGRVVIDAEGRPSYRAKGPGGAPEVVATCPVPIFGRLVVTGGTATAHAGTRAGGPDPKPIVDRTICRLYVEDLDAGDVCMADRVAVRGCGAPFDGEHLLTLAYDDPAGGPPFVEFLVPGHGGVGRAPTPGGEVVPTGEHQDVGHGAGDPHLPRRQRRPAALRVRRQGHTVQFWEAGRLLGSATASLPAGPSGSGVVSTIGGPGAGGPDLLPTRAEGFVAPLSAADAAALDVRLCARVSGVVDFAGNPCHVDCESFPGVPRRQSQLYDFCVLFTDEGGNLLDGPADPDSGDRRGVGYGDFSACRLGDDRQNATTRYRVHVAAFGKRWDTTGAPLPPRLVGIATVAEPTRLPWPRAIHVDAGVGDDATGDGSETAPYRSFDRARDAATPGTVVRLRQPEPPARGVGAFANWQARGLVGPILFTTWGPGRTRVDQGWPWECLVVNGSRHLTFRRLELHHRTSQLRDFTKNSPGGSEGDPRIGSPEQGHTAIDCFNSVGIGFDDLRSSGADLKPEEVGGWGTLLNTGACSFLALHDVETAGADGGYQIFGTQTVRRASFRRIRFGRGSLDGAHLIRMAGGDAVEWGGVVAANPRTPGHWAPGVSYRYAPRRFTTFDCDFQDYVFAMQPYADGYDPSDPHDNATTHRCATLRTRGHEMKCEIPGGHRFSQCYSQGGGAFTTAEDYDTAALKPYPVAFEGCRYAGGVQSILSPILAAPDDGPRRNRPSADDRSGEPLTAPATIALPAPAGWAALATDGLPQGGTGPRRSGWRLDGVASPDTPASVLALPLAAGTYQAWLDVADSDPVRQASALGAEVMMVVFSGDVPPGGYLLSPPVPASGLAGEPSAPFTVTLSGAGGPVTVTPGSDGPGRFDPPRLTLSTETPSATFRFVPAPAPGGIGTWKIWATNDAELDEPGFVTFAATVPAGRPIAPSVSRPIPWDPVPEVRSGDRVEVRSLAARPPRNESDRRGDDRPGVGRRSLAARPRRQGP